MNRLEVQALLDLPEPLPAGEELLWLDRPRWQQIAVRVCHLRLIGAYFALLSLWRGGQAYAEGGAAAAFDALASGLPLIAVVVGLAVGFAWLVARTTVYAITTRRTLLRIGVALSLTINVPHRLVNGAAVRAFADGSGDIPLVLAPGNRLGYAVLWPHARPWRLGRPEPMLRAVPEALKVARILADAVAAYDPDIRTHAVAVPVAPRPATLAPVPSAGEANLT